MRSTHTILLLQAPSTTMAANFKGCCGKTLCNIQSAAGPNVANVLAFLAGHAVAVHAAIAGALVAVYSHNYNKQSALFTVPIFNFVNGLALTMDIHICGPDQGAGLTAAQWGTMLLAALPTIGWAFLGSHTRPIAGQMVQFDFYQQTGGGGAAAEASDTSMLVFGNPEFGAQRRADFESMVETRLLRHEADSSSSRDGLCRALAECWSAFSPASELAMPASFNEVYNTSIIYNLSQHQRMYISYTDAMHASSCSTLITTSSL
jgi:hypothetical protein